MTRAAKAKGRGGQNEIVSLLYDAFPELEEGDIKGVTMGEGGVDIILSPAARRIIPLSIEVKRRKNSMVTAYKWLDEAGKRLKPGQTPVVFYRSDRKKWLAILPGEDYINLLKENHEKS